MSYSAWHLGRHYDSIDIISDNMFGKSIAELDTFTKTDYDEFVESYGEELIKNKVVYEKLPEEKEFYDVNWGLENFKNIRRLIKRMSRSDQESWFYGNQKFVLKDLDEIIKLLKKTKKEKRRWSLIFDAES